METMENALKNAGWSEDLIKAYFYTDYEIPNPISASDCILEPYYYKQGEIDYPQKVDMTTFIVS